VLDDSGAKTENTLISSARMKTGNPDIVKAQLEAAKSPTMHPLVRTHPETGTKAVWFHKAKTETVTGMSPEETQDFLQDLTDRITQPGKLASAAGSLPCYIWAAYARQSTRCGRLSWRKTRGGRDEVQTVSHDIDRASGCFSHLQRGRRDVGCRFHTAAEPAHSM